MGPAWTSLHAEEASGGARRMGGAVLGWDNVKKKWDGVAGGVRDAVALARSDATDRDCAVLNDGKVMCWGTDQEQEARHGTAGLKRQTVADAVRGVGPASAVSIGFRHTCALEKRGTVKCWGLNDHGEVGDGTHLPGVDPKVAARERAERCKCKSEYVGRVRQYVMWGKHVTVAVNRAQCTFTEKDESNGQFHERECGTRE